MQQPRDPNTDYTKIPDPNALDLDESSPTFGEQRSFALGRGDYLDQFARAHDAETWKDLADPNNWKQGVWDKLSDPDVTIHFNLQGISDPMASVSRVAAGQPYSGVD